MCRKQFITAIFLAFFFFGICQGYSGGSGTEADPYQISIISDWQQLMDSNDDWGKHFILTADLDLQGVAMVPVGNYEQHFTGVFDGNSHTFSKAVIPHFSQFH